MSSFIPDNIISEIKSKMDILDLLSKYISVIKTGNRYKALCPFHNEKTPSFVISKENQAYHCFGCGKGGNIFTFVMDKENLSFPESIQFIPNMCGVLVPDKSLTGDAKEYKEKQEQKKILLDIHREASKFFTNSLFQKEGSSGLSYIRKRGISDDIIYRFELGFAPDSWNAITRHLLALNYSKNNIIASGLVKTRDDGGIYDHFRNRIVFPIQNEYGEIVAFSCRTIQENSKEGKYVNSPETPIFKKSRILYGLSKAKEGIKKSNFVILCEGQLDVIAMHRAGFENSVAPQGTAFTEEQSSIIKRFTNKVYICFDGDSAGITATLRSIDILLPMEFDVKVINLPEGEDPDSIFTSTGSSGIEKYVNSASDFLDFAIKVFSSKIDIKSPVGKTEVVTKLLEKISKIRNQVLRTSYISIISEKIGISQSILISELDRISKNDFSNRTSKPQEIKDIEKRIETKSKRMLCEETLLKLILLDGNAGRRIDEELPHEMISDSAIGIALNLAISLTINEEWENIPKELNKMLLENSGSPLSEILAVVDTEKVPNTLETEKIISDCIRLIFNEFRQSQIYDLKKKLLSSSNIDEKSKILLEINELQKKVCKL